MPDVCRTVCSQKELEPAKDASQPPGSLDHKRIDSDQIARK